MKTRLLCGILLIALGAGVYFYPDWSAVRTKHQQEQADPAVSIGRIYI